MNDPIYKIVNLSRHYNRGQHTVKAVDAIDFEIEKGSSVAIVGSSGSGKSTLLNLLAGLDQPTLGEIFYSGISLNSMNRKELANYRAEKIGMVFQSFNLIPHYTALKNVEIGLFFNGIPSRQRKKMASDTLTQLGLEDRMSHIPADLSGGEQQRVALARALVKKPEVLFADEPTGNLDQGNTNAISNLLNELNSKGLTIVMVTHDMQLAKNNAKKIIKMDYGKIISDSGRT